MDSALGRPIAGRLQEFLDEVVLSVSSTCLPWDGACRCDCHPFLSSLVSEDTSYPGGKAQGSSVPVPVRAKLGTVWIGEDKRANVNVCPGAWTVLEGRNRNSSLYAGVLFTSDCSSHWCPGWGHLEAHSQILFLST